MIIGTAGHIDHGKSALVEALTGRTMDPLAEERRRGITMDLHFAPLRLATGGVVGVVDVPGHEDLVRAMVAGAAGLDLVLLIVAADEGIMPQTREHLAIVEQLRIPAGIPVITKADLVEPEWLAMVSAEVGAWLSDSAIRFTPPQAVSARTGAGIDGLRALLETRLAGGTTRGAANDLLRLPIDRAFSLPGAGTVVTGTLWSGQVRLGDRVRLLPAGLAGRVRSLEQHGTAVEASTPGDRVAVALAGVEREAVRRGAVLVAGDSPWETTRALDVHLQLLATAPRPLGSQARVRLHLGTLEALARVHLPAPIPPGGSGFARLTLEEPILARGGDRVVVRSYSPVATIGGGVVLDPLPPRGRARWDAQLSAETPEARLAALLARRPGGVAADLMPILLGLPPGAAAEVARRPGFVERNGWVLSEASVQEATDRLLQVLAAYHRDHPADPGIPLETLRAGGGMAGQVAVDRLVEAGRWVIGEGLVRDAGFRPRAPGGESMLERVVAHVERAGLAPPSTRELEAELKAPGTIEAIRLAVRAGRLVAVEPDRHYGTQALARFSEILAELASRGPITPPAVRDATGISRKYLIPLLEWADRTGLTLRAGDARQAGPRLAPAVARRQAAAADKSSGGSAPA